MSGLVCPLSECPLLELSLYVQTASSTPVTIHHTMSSLFLRTEPEASGGSSRDDMVTPGGQSQMSQMQRMGGLEEREQEREELHQLET